MQDNKKPATASPKPVQPAVIVAPSIANLKPTPFQNLPSQGAAVIAIPSPAYAAQAAEPYPLSREDAPSSGPLNDLPIELNKQIEAIEIWASGNEKDAKADRIKTWSLKLPAILISACSGFIFNSNSAALTVFGIISAVLIGIDAFIHPGDLYRIHWLAFSELRNLENNIPIWWSTSMVGSDDEKNESLKKILRKIAKERMRISEYLRTAEAGVYK